MYKIRNFSLIFIFTMVKDKVIQVYAPNINAKEAERFYDNIQDFIELTPKKRCPFHHRTGMQSVRSQEIPGISGQAWPWSTKWSRATANRVLPREYNVHSKHPLPTT